jgi:hypothetical protein
MPRSYETLWFPSNFSPRQHDGFMDDPRFFLKAHPFNFTTTCVWANVNQRQEDAVRDSQAHEVRLRGRTCRQWQFPPCACTPIKYAFECSCRHFSIIVGWSKWHTSKRFPPHKNHGPRPIANGHCLLLSNPLGSCVPRRLHDMYRKFSKPSTREHRYESGSVLPY